MATNLLPAGSAGPEVRLDDVYVFDPTSPAFCECLFRPDELTELLRERVAAGRPAAVIPLGRVVSMGYAADFLGMAPFDVRRLLDDGTLPGVADGVRFADLYRYRRQETARRRAALDELDRIQAELGLEG